MQTPATHSYRSALAILVSVLVFVLAASGCAYGEMRQVVRAQFASELNCPDAHADNRKSYDEGYKPGQLKVQGCGVIRLYTCPPDTGLVSYDDKSCTFEEVAAAPMGGAAPAPSPAAADPATDEQLMDEPMSEPEPEAAPEKPKGKAGKTAPKPSGKFKASLSTDTSADTSLEAGDE